MQIRKHDGSARLTLSGEVTIYTVSTLKAELTTAIRGQRELEVDLSAVSEMDSAGLQLLLLIKGLPETVARFVAPSPIVRRFAELANVVETLGLAADDPAAAPAET